jgi:hypothetical protein
MSTSARMNPTAVDVSVSDVAPHVVLADGRELSVPLVWFPRLRDSTPAQRSHGHLIGRGEGIHWPGVDEDGSVSGLLRVSYYGPWVEARRAPVLAGCVSVAA